jgi:UDP-glucose:(heptosyl)LPS alpha-1,3-glucosyltransferase
MRIAFLVHDFDYRSGHSRYVVELAKRFCAEHEVHIFAHRCDRSLLNENIKFHFVPTIRWNGITTIISFFLSSTIAVRGKFDVIHAQGVCGLRHNVITAHICNKSWLESRLKTGEAVPLKERIFCRFAAVCEYLVYRLSKHSLVISVSNRIARDLQEHYRCSSLMKVVYHGVNSKQFAPASSAAAREEVRSEWGVKDSDLVALFVGNLRKGAYQALQATQMVPNLRTVFVSALDPAPYRRLAAELRVENRVVFASFSNQIWRSYAACDLFLFPTPYDPFGLVQLEAMSAGVPTIASREAGASELIQDGKNGLLLHDHTDPNELAALIARLGDSRTGAREIGQAARQTAERYSWDLTAAETLAVYNELLNVNDLSISQLRTAD